MKKRRARRPSAVRRRNRKGPFLVVLPHPARDRFHPVLQLELLFLEGGLLDLLLVAQHGLVRELAQARFVLVMLLVKALVLLVLEETLRRTGVLGHRHLRIMKVVQAPVGQRREGRRRGGPDFGRYRPPPAISRLISAVAEAVLAQDDRVFGR